MSSQARQLSFVLKCTAVREKIVYYVKHRPKKEGGGFKAREWWLYAYKCVMFDLRKDLRERFRRSWRYLEGRRRVRLEYCGLYGRWMEGGGLSRKENKRMRDIESGDVGGLEVDDIVVFRAMVHKKSSTTCSPPRRRSSVARKDEEDEEEGGAERGAKRRASNDISSEENRARSYFHKRSSSSVTTTIILILFAIRFAHRRQYFPQSCHVACQQHKRHGNARGRKEDVGKPGEEKGDRETYRVLGQTLQKIRE